MPSGYRFTSAWSGRQLFIEVKVSDGSIPPPVDEDDKTTTELELHHMHETSPRTAVGLLAVSAVASICLATSSFGDAGAGELLVSLVRGESSDSLHALADVIHGTGGTNHSQILLIR